MPDQADAGALADDPLVAATPALATGLQVLATRQGDEFTAFDGHVAGFADELGDRLARPRSAGALAAYATCPRSFLFAHLLGVQTEEEPRHWLDIDALDRGNLVHTTLERFVGETLPGAPPPPDAAAAPGSEDRLFELFDEQAAQLEATGRTGLPLLWQLEKRRISRRLEQWLEDDARLRDEECVAPVAVELGFGMGEHTRPPLAVPTAAGVELSLRGKVDRVDASPDGGQVVVTDYKTGQMDRYKKLAEDITLGGSELQATVYGMVAADEHPDAEVHVGYWHVGDKPRKQGEPELVAFDEAARARGQQVLDTIADGVVAGVFPAVPGAETLWPQPGFEHCRFCPFDTICPSHAERARAADRDLADPAVAERLLALWDPDGGADAADGEVAP